MTTENKESLETELAKVTKDRELSMKKKDELTGILSQAAQALRDSLVVSLSSLKCLLLFLKSDPT